MRPSDLVLVGGGYRTTTLLASAPDLLERRTSVVEADRSLGAGGFSRYAITSTSVGSRFFKEVDRDRFGSVLADPVVTRVADARNPVPMPDLAAALDRLGQAVTESLGERLILGRRVLAVDVRSHGPGVTLTFADGTIIRSGVAVLATGRTEREHPALRPFRDRTWLSGAVISREGRARLEATLAAADGGEVVIAGCSHSAMSALGVMLEARSSLRGRIARYRGPAVTLLRRSPTRLMYDSVEAARAGQIPAREQLLESDADVCPDSGIVFRDSGLRHEARQLFCDLWAGRVEGARVRDVDDLDRAEPLLDRAKLVVQALGYHGAAPDIRLDGRLVRPTDSPERLVADEDGAAVLAGRPHQALSVLRVEPTPPELRDHAVYGARLYARLAGRLNRQLSELEVEHDRVPAW
jgi:hypothetical protein